MPSNMNAWRYMNLAMRWARFMSTRIQKVASNGICLPSMPILPDHRIIGAKKRPTSMWSANIRWINSMRQNSILISIMLYQFDGALIKGGRPTKSNTKMSRGDKRFIKQQYP